MEKVYLIIDSHSMYKEAQSIGNPLPFNKYWKERVYFYTSHSFEIEFRIGMQVRKRVVGVKLLNILDDPGESKQQQQ